MAMIQRRFYLPEEMYTRLQLLAKTSKKTITNLLREMLDEGLKTKFTARAGRSAKALLKLARLAEKERWSGPGDLSIHHDKYFVEAYEKLKEKKGSNRK